MGQTHEELADSGGGRRSNRMKLAGQTAIVTGAGGSASLIGKLFLFEHSDES